MKNEKLTDKVFGLRMTLSFLTVIACLAVMASSAYALFYKNISAQPSTLVGAYYTIEVTKTENNVFRAPLAHEDMHIFEIKSAGTASIGYCKIEIDGRVYYTQLIPQDGSIILKIQAARDSVIVFTPQWGEPPASLLSDTFSLRSTALENGATLFDSVTPHAVYTIEPAAKLSSIAAHYGVTEQEIMIYNNLVATASELDDTPSVALETGKELKIPGEAAVLKDAEAPYAVPYAVYVMEPTAKTSDIAAYYDVPEEDIIAFNPPENFALWQELKIPNAAEREVGYAVPFATYTVEPTAKLENISSHYKISEADILAYNHITEIKKGEPLNIPGVPNDAEPYAVPFTTYEIEPTARLHFVAAFYGVEAQDILDYNNIEYLIADTTIKIPSPNQTEMSYSVPFVGYTVEVTAKIENIANHYGITYGEILRFNRIEKIEVGQTLKIPYPETSEKYCVPTVSYVIPPVAKLEAIATYYGVAMGDILAYNNIAFIYSGLEIKIPSPQPTLVPYSVPYTRYKVEPTATIDNIANHYGVSSADIEKFNEIQSIAVGQMLKIPYPRTSDSYAVPFAVYTVPEGATVENIAKHYGITPADITIFNPGIEIKPSVSIKIPGVASDAAPYVPPVKAETTTTPEQTTAPAETTTTPEQTTAPAETTTTPEQTTAPAETTTTPEQTTSPANIV